MEGYACILGYGDLGRLWKKNCGDTHCTQMLLRHVLFCDKPDVTCFWCIHNVFLSPWLSRSKFTWCGLLRSGLQYSIQKSFSSSDRTFTLMEGLRISHFGCLWEGKFRLEVFNVCSYGKYLVVRSACSLVGYRDASTDHTKHFDPCFLH